MALLLLAKNIKKMRQVRKLKMAADTKQIGACASTEMDSTWLKSVKPDHR